MTFQYEQAVPWGRSFDEYQHMFRLTPDDLKRSILGCADGPASFNAQMARRGYHVVSCDPLYQLTGDQIEARIVDAYEDVIGQTRQNLDQFLWNEIKTPDELCRVAREVRIFPLLATNARPSPLVGPVAEHLRRAGRGESFERVPYEFQRGGNCMLRITSLE